MNKRIYAIQALDIGLEDPYAVSHDLNELKKLIKEELNDVEAYIIEGKEIRPGVWKVDYDLPRVWEWKPKEEGEG